MAMALMRYKSGSQAVYQRGEKDPHPSFDGLRHPRAPKAVQEGRNELDTQNAHVGGDAQRHLEQDRIRLRIPRQHQVVGLPVATEVEHHRDAGEQVAEEARHQRGPHQRRITIAVEDVDEQGHREAAATQRRANDDVDGDPYAPGVAAVQIGDGAEPEEHACGDEVRADARQHRQ